ncbi:MAG: 50S ribosomal protein L12 [Candidatus Pacearchaeota archaeon]
MEYIYAALLLHKLGQAINEENLKKVISATGTTVDENKVKVVVASLSGINIDEQLANASLVTASSQPSQQTVEAPKEEKKEEPKAEAAEGLAALFG